jgi:PAS domain S-box-containing protein
VFRAEETPGRFVHACPAGCNKDKNARRCLFGRHAGAANSDNRPARPPANFAMLDAKEEKAPVLEQPGLTMENITSAPGEICFDDTFRNVVGRNTFHALCTFAGLPSKTERGTLGRSSYCRMRVAVVSRGEWFMSLGLTPRWFSPADESSSSLKLFDSVDQWRSLFERSPLGVAMIDSGFHFVVANPAFLTMFGYTCEELQQLPFLDICIDEARDECRVHLRELSEGVRRKYEVETLHRCKDGTFLPVNTYLSAVCECGPNQRTFLTVTVDISARRAAEDALRAAQAELGRIARLTTVGAMAATIAHELNQPLAAIVTNGNAGLRWLDRSEPNLEEARSAFGRVVNEGHRAAQIITSIRAMFKKDSGARSPTAINELVCDVLSTSLGELKSRGVSLELHPTIFP